jgi:hypothetical protein
MNAWTGIPEDFEPSENDHGFVYLMTIKNPDTEKLNYYIGIKKFRKRIKRAPLKGFKRKRICYVDSKWRDYTSSSESLNKWLELGIPVEREILRIVESQWELNYFENLYIMNSHSVFRDDFLNGFAGFRQNKPPKALQKKFEEGSIDFTLPDRIKELAAGFIG